MSPGMRRGGPSSDSPPQKSNGLHTAAREQAYAETGLARAIANTDDWWLSCALMGIVTLAAQRRPFDAFELTKLGVPDPDHPNRWGAVFRLAHTAGAIRPVGYGPSRRPSTAGSAVRIWQGVGGA